VYSIKKRVNKKSSSHAHILIFRRKSEGRERGEGRVFVVLELSP